MRIFLTCTPRTGNLWIRRVIAHALDLPQVASHNPADVGWDGLPDRCLVAMHWHYSQEFHDFVRRRGFSILVTTRHPIDVLVSILRFAPLEPATARWLEGEGGDERSLVHATPASDEFAQYCLSRRAEVLLGVSQEWRHTADDVVRYEDFLPDPVEATTRILNTLGARPVVDVRQAVDANAMDKLRPLAASHVWRGRAGEWKHVVTAPLAHQIAARHASVFRDFGYACDPDPALDAAAAREHWEQIVAGR
jgi:hypothetical protein